MSKEWKEFWDGPCPVCEEVPAEMQKKKPGSWRSWATDRAPMLAHLHIDHSMWPSGADLPCCSWNCGSWADDKGHLEAQHSPGEFKKLIAMIALSGRRWTPFKA